MSVESCIKKHLNQQVVNKHPVGTGLFSAYQVELSDGNQVFIKYQSHSNQQLIHEAAELSLLGNTIHTPQILGSCEHCLILAWIETVQNPHVQSQIGQALAKLHQNNSQYFGFHIDNKIGNTPQLNAVGENANNWIDFYWTYRLLYQIELAHKNNLLSTAEYQKLLRIENSLPELLDKNIKPSLLHGDLWSGNVLSGENHPYFIDPACYYGHREMDFALTFMFGGFSHDFYNSYAETHPLEAGFEKRKPLYMLYHYLNHLNIFGNSYHVSVMRCHGTLLQTG